MQLAKKKELASRVLGVGKGRIIFVESRTNEIKEAITRQDIIDLHKSGAILIKDLCGRRKNVKRKNRRRVGKVKKHVLKTKKEYITLTRKFRKYCTFLLKTKKIDKEKYKTARRMIRARKFKSKRHLNDSLGEI